VWYSANLAGTDEKVPCINEKSTMSQRNRAQSNSMKKDHDSMKRGPDLLKKDPDSMKRAQT